MSRSELMMPPVKIILVPTPQKRSDGLKTSTLYLRIISERELLQMRNGITFKTETEADVQDMILVATTL